MTGREILAEMLDLIDRSGPCLQTIGREVSGRHVCALRYGHDGQHRDLFDRLRWNQ